MKTLLQLDLESNFNKTFYSISKNSFKVLTSPQKQFYFDHICYKVDDINTTILHDIVIKISEKINQTHQFTVILDRSSKSENIHTLIKGFEGIEIFKKEKIQLGHFTLFNDCLFDYHKTRWNLEEESFRTFSSKNSQKEEIEFQNREITICQQIKSQQIYLIPQTIVYRDIHEKEEEPSFSSTTSKLFKSQMKKKEKELENKKVMEFYILKIGQKCKINISILNYNKSYSLNAQQKKELSDLLMLFGADMGQIKYKTINIELLHIFMKKAEEVFFVNYFPLPLNDVIVVKNSEYEAKLNSTRYQPNKYHLLDKYCDEAFMYISFLSSKSKEVHEKIILTYLEEKQLILKQELDKMSDRLKELKIIHRVQEEQITDITLKSRRALEKFIDNINYLRGKGITNVRKHVDWLNSITDEKRQIIKEEEQEIDKINRRIIESRRNNDYFVGKMELFREKLKKNYEQILKKKWETWKIGESKSEIERNKKLNFKENSIHLTPSQKEQLENYKEKLKIQLKERLKNCKEKSVFMEHLNQVKKRGSKMDISRYEQKYIELLHD